MMPHHPMPDSYLVFWESFNLHQCLDFPTHIHGHSLDLMICSSGCNVLSVSTSGLILDHFSVVSDLQIPSSLSRTVPQTIKYRKLLSINIEAFKADTKNSELIGYPKTKATGLAQQYDSVLHTLINLHAPLVTKKISPKPPIPWITPAILASKRHRRYLEHVWRRNLTALNRSRPTRQTHLCNRQMSKQNQVTIPKLLLNTMAIIGHCGRHLTNSYCYCCRQLHLLYHSSIVALANAVSSCFINKISVIRSSFPTDSHSRVLKPPDTRKVLQNVSLPMRCTVLTYKLHASLLT